jgi:hypothetical protein
LGCLLARSENSHDRECYPVNKRELIHTFFCPRLMERSFCGGRDPGGLAAVYSFRILRLDCIDPFFWEYRRFL